MEISISGRGVSCALHKAVSPQLLLVMKLIVVMITVGCLQVSARTFSQTVSLSGKNLPLTTVFSDIERQTGLSFFFNMALIKDTKPVTLELHDVSLETALHAALRGESLDFYQAGKTVFIIKKVVPSPANVEPALSNDKILTITGRVINEREESMPGASVAVKGTNKGTLTNEKGEFELKGVAAGAIIEISYLGYQRKEVSVASESALTVRLAIATNKLDEAQVIAYGKTSARLSTGDVTTVGAATIQEQPVTNPLQALAGRVPGLFISQTTGFAGAGMSVQIMGQSSVKSGTDPLYVVDGVPYTAQTIRTITYTMGGIYTTSSPLSFLNPGDIESISVLKDADATAIYGSRAASGAILITTKKGRPGRTLVDLNLQNGIGNDTRRLKLLNREQYLSMRREAFRNDGIAKFGATDYDVNGTWDSTRSTDWQKALLSGNAQYTDLQGDVSGGTVNSQILVGGNFHRETTIFSNQFADEKGTVHFNTRNTSSNQKFYCQLNGSYQFDQNHLPYTDLTGLAPFLAPDAPALKNADGSLNWAPDANGNSTWANPLANNYVQSILKTNNLVSNAILSYQFVTGLEAKVSAGYTNLQTNESLESPILAVAPENRSSPSNRYSLFANYNINSWIVEPQVSYKHLLAGGQIESVVGGTIEHENRFGQTITARGFNTDQQLGDIGAATTLTGATNAAAIYKYAAAFGRINYNWRNKWIVNLTARRDGSSRFGSANQFHNFGSAAAAWVFSESKIIQRLSRVVSFGKLSANYGTTGNDQIGDYQFLSLYRPPLNVATAYQGATGLLPTGFTNPYLEWEETRKMRWAVDLGFFRDRILISAAYFLNRSSNELLLYKLPSVTGFTNITKNFPATIQNSGWELTVNTANIKGNKFSWSTSVNMTVPYNKLVSFPGLISSSYASSLVIGQPVNVSKVLNLIGVNPLTGLYQFADGHGNPTQAPNFSTDKTALINPNPRFYGGVQNSFSYRGWQMDIFFQFVKQEGSNNFGRIGNYPGKFSSSGSYGNQPTVVLHRWQIPGDNATIQLFSTQSNSNFVYASALSNAIWSDASYIRLKNLSLSWQMPDPWRKKAQLQDFRIFAQGQNLLTITKYLGLDPETPSSLILPPLRVITIGVRLVL